MPTRRKRIARRMTRRVGGGTSLVSNTSLPNDVSISPVSNTSLPNDVSISSMSTSTKPDKSNVHDKHEHVYAGMSNDSTLKVNSADDSPTDSATEVFPQSDFVDAAKIRIILYSKKKKNREKIKALKKLVPP